MKTQVKENIKSAKRLFEVIEQRKLLEKEEAELKGQIKDIMGDEVTLEANGILITLTPRINSRLDEDAIMHDMGKAFIDKYTVKSETRVMKVINTQKRAVNE